MEWLSGVTCIQTKSLELEMAPEPEGAAGFDRFASFACFLAVACLWTSWRRFLLASFCFFFLAAASLRCIRSFERVSRESNTVLS